MTVFQVTHFMDRLNKYRSTVPYLRILRVSKLKASLAESQKFFPYIAICQNPNIITEDDEKGPFAELYTKI